MRVATQNVGGMRGEFKQGQGSKMATLRTLVDRHTDFLILTEVKARRQDIGKRRIKRDLEASTYSLDAEARKGVIVYSNKNHALVEGSQREGVLPGHIAAAVYMVGTSRVIVAGVYGDSASNDRTSAAVMTELKDSIEELMHVYNTRAVIMAGDFNITTDPRDSNARAHSTKPQAARQLLTMIEDLQLTDLALAARKPWHTWYRSSAAGQSSRIDRVLTNLDTTTVQVRPLFTIFDHVYLEASFQLERTQRKAAMQDHILGSDEFLMSAYDIMEQHMATYPEASREGRGENGEELPSTQEQEEGAGPPPPLDQGREFNKPEEGHTALHAFNTLLSKLGKLHDRIHKGLKKKQADKLQVPSRRLLWLKQQLKRDRTEAGRERIHEEIGEIQKSIKDDMEAKDLATRTRISNFYKSRTGKMVPETFSCIKDPHRSRRIHRIEHEGRDITAPDEIVEVMQQWFENTARAEVQQTQTLAEFLEEHDLQLPQLAEEDKEELEEAFTSEEVKEAIKEAKEVSAPGPSGQTITLFKLVFMEAPELMTQALNQMVYVPSLVRAKEFQWIQERTVVYIPKKNSPATPADYRPLSLLEVLYKIPARILARRLTKVLPTLVGEHQHGFMPQRGIQEPSLIATHTIEEASSKNKPLQLVSVDTEKAFDSVGHRVIVQALRAFGVPEIMVQALQQYTLVGYARVEVNGRKGLLITIRTGSGQGDPLSSILFLLASEPLNRAIAKKHRDLMYKTEGGLRIGPKLYADDGLLPLSLRTSEDLRGVLSTYEGYYNVSGLKVNVNKTMALCINTTEELKEGIRNIGVSTPEHIKHLGLHLGKNIELTMAETLRQISPKAIQRRIMATTPPTDMLHRSLLINTAFTPIYNHVMMALPIGTEHTAELDKVIKDFLWTRQKEGQTRQRRIRVSKRRLAASLDMGGLNIAAPAENAKGFRMNLIQRIYMREMQEIPTQLPSILHELLTRAGAASLQQHVTDMGPTEWRKTGEKIARSNSMLGMAFKDIADLLMESETAKESWHCAAVIGHTEAMQLTHLEKQQLRGEGVVTVAQLLVTEENGNITNEIDMAKMQQITQPGQWLRTKLIALMNRITRLRLPTADKQAIGMTTGHLILRGDRKPSQIHRRNNIRKLSRAIGTAPAYRTREKDGVYRPDEDTFTAGYKILEGPLLPSKTKEMAFEVLNRTIWTNNKAYKSGLTQSPNCDRCGQTETMEHLLHDCEYYSTPLWEEVGAMITAGIQERKGEEVARMALTAREIIFNAPHPSLKVHVLDSNARKAVLLLIQEVKRSIVHKRMNPTTRHNQPTPRARLQAHLLATACKIKSYLQYIGTSDYNEAALLMEAMISKARERIE